MALRPLFFENLSLTLPTLRITGNLRRTRERKARGLACFSCCGESVDFFKIAAPLL